MTRRAKFLSPLVGMVSKASHLAALALPLILWSCGENAFKSADEPDPREEAVKFMESYQPEKAVTTLLKALGSDLKAVYDNMPNLTATEITTNINAVITTLKASGVEKVPAMISILASAHGQIYGIDPFALALALASGNSASLHGTEQLSLLAEDGNAIAALYPALPDATEVNKTGLNQTLAILNAIDTPDLIPADHFKKSLFLMANASLLTKSLDSDLDGKISLQEAQALVPSDAESLFDLMTLALEAVLSSGEGDNAEVAATSAKSIAQVKEKLESMEGSDETEKARNFVVAQTATKDP